MNLVDLFGRTKRSIKTYLGNEPGWETVEQLDVEYDECRKRYEQIESRNKSMIWTSGRFPLGYKCTLQVAKE